MVGTTGRNDWRRKEMAREARVRALEEEKNLKGGMGGRREVFIQLLVCSDDDTWNRSDS